MSNAERLIAILAPIFADGETVIDEARIEQMVAVTEPLITEDFTVVMGGGEGFVASYEGVSGMREAWRDWLETFERVTLEFEAVEAVGDNVLVLVRQVGVTRHGGVEMEQPSASVWKFRGQQLGRLEFHLDREMAARSAQSAQE